MRVLLLDNYDSFVGNLVQLLAVLGAEPLRVRNDRITVDAALDLAPAAIVLSPGPGTPEDPAYAGIGVEFVRRAAGRIPVLGVCLGHQAIAYALGGRVVRAPRVMHGKTSLVHHDGSTLFRGLPSPLRVMRYHSLVADAGTLPRALRVTARTDDGLAMAFEHEAHPLYGVQFHPESIGTPEGEQIVGRFLDVARQRCALRPRA